MPAPYRRASAAVLTMAVLTGCGSPPATDAALPTDDALPTDAMSTDVAPTDAGGCGESRIDFTYQYPGEAPQSGCAPLEGGGVLVDYLRNDGGACMTTDTRAVGRGQYFVVVQAQNRELFASAGTFPVDLVFQDPVTCAFDGGSCTFNNGVNACSLQVTVAGPVGTSLVEGSLAAPCTLQNPLSRSASVQILTLRVHGGPVLAATTGSPPPAPCP